MASDPGRIVSPVTGRVARLAVAVGETVEEGSPLVVIEAMKMETVLSAKAAGRVGAIHVLEGEQVQAGEIVVELELAEVEA